MNTLPNLCRESIKSMEERIRHAQSTSAEAQDGLIGRKRRRIKRHDLVPLKIAIFKAMGNSHPNGQPVCKKWGFYRKALRLYLIGEFTKPELDAAVLYTLGETNVHLHNEFIRGLVQNTLCSGEDAQPALISDHLMVQDEMDNDEVVSHHHAHMGEEGAGQGATDEEDLQQDLLSYHRLQAIFQNEFGRDSPLWNVWLPMKERSHGLLIEEAHVQEKEREFMRIKSLMEENYLHSKKNASKGSTVAQMLQDKTGLEGDSATVLRMYDASRLVRTENAGASINDHSVYHRGEAGSLQEDDMEGEIPPATLPGAMYMHYILRRAAEIRQGQQQEEEEGEQQQGNKDDERITALLPPTLSVLSSNPSLESGLLAGKEESPGTSTDGSPALLPPPRPPVAPKHLAVSRQAIETLNFGAQVFVRRIFERCVHVRKRRRRELDEREFRRTPMERGGKDETKDGSPMSSSSASAMITSSSSSSVKSPALENIPSMPLVEESLPPPLQAFEINGHKNCSVIGQPVDKSDGLSDSASCLLSSGIDMSPMKSDTSTSTSSLPSSTINRVNVLRSDKANERYLDTSTLIEALRLSSSNIRDPIGRSFPSHDLLEDVRLSSHFY